MCWGAEVTEDTKLMSWWHRKDKINGVSGVVKAEEKPDSRLDESDGSPGIHPAATPQILSSRVKAE